MPVKYTESMFKDEIQPLIHEQGYDPVVVAKFTSNIYFSRIADIDLKLREKMLDIMTMEDGFVFEMAKQEFDDLLNKI